MRTAVAVAPMASPSYLDAASARRMRRNQASGRLSGVRYSPCGMRLSIEMNAKVAGPSDAAIEFRDVSYYINDIPGRAIVSNVSLTITRGETLVLLGRSGSGKTTLLRLIIRMLVPSEGQVLFEDPSTTEADPIRLRRGIGYVIQEAG